MFKMQACPDAMKGTEIEELFTRSELAKMTVSQRIKYEESLMTRNDILNSIAEQTAAALAEGKEVGRAEGREVGLAEGRKVGLAEGRIEIIRLMRDKGMSSESIAEIVNMPPDEIEDILA